MEGEMAFLLKQKLTLFKVFVLICLTWFIFTFSSSSYFSGIIRINTPNSQAIDSKTLEILKELKEGEAKHISHEIKGGCEPNGIFVDSGSDSSNVSCKLTPATPEACDVIKGLFGSQEVEKCSGPKLDICEIKEVSPGDFRVHCQQKFCNGSIKVGVMNEKNGELEWELFASTVKLADRIAEIIHPSSVKKHFGFCFIHCKAVEKYVADDYDSYESYDTTTASQLLILPPQVKFKQRRNVAKKASLIDINLILLDSVSRAHFYRSLPKVLRAFEDINRHDLRAKVFDFRLFQAIKPRTYESINALFGGVVEQDEKPFGTYDKPYRPLSYETILAPLKKHGYRTLFLEDLCWSWEWGITKDLLVMNKSSPSASTWRRLIKTLHRTGIDDIDISVASCEMLRANDQNDPFHGLPKICYNGRHMNEYFLEYLHAYQTKLSSVQEQFLTYYANDDSHEEFGTRLRTLDDKLSEYIKKSLHNQNMITVIFSDHGNSYGPLIESTFEGRLEMYRSSLFIIIPEKVRHKLGQKKMAALAANQNRLTSLLDLHYTIQSLIPDHQLLIPKHHNQYHMNPDGLFSEVSPNRTCLNMPHLQPHLCICKGYQMPVSNTSANALLADFALGSLNNIIQAQYRDAHPSARSGHGSCQRLVAQSFTNVRESNEPDGSIITRLDLHVGFTEPSGRRSDEIFFVSVKSRVGKSGAMKVISFSRMTKYGRFEKCADKGIHPHLCVCSLHLNVSHVSGSGPVGNIMLQQPKVLQTETEAYPVDEENCLHLLIRRYSIGASFEALNTCSKRRYRMILTLKTRNMDSSHRLPIDIVIEADGQTFLTVLRQRMTHKEWTWSYGVQYGFVEV